MVEMIVSENLGNFGMFVIIKKITLGFLKT